jgi:hypothetical protein
MSSPLASSLVTNLNLTKEQRQCWHMIAFAALSLDIDPDDLRSVAGHSDEIEQRAKVLIEICTYHLIKLSKLNG